MNCAVWVEVATDPLAVLAHITVFVDMQSQKLIPRLIIVQL